MIRSGAAERLARWLRQGRTQWLYAADPAAHTCLTLVAARLERVGGLGRWIYDGWCRSEAGLRGAPFDGIDPDEARGGRCLVGAQYDFGRNRSVLAQLADMGVETLYLFDTWAHYARPFVDEQTGDVLLPDRIGVPDELARVDVVRALSEHGVDAAARVEVVGQPDLEALAEAIAAVPPADVEAYRAELGIGTGRLWLFLTEPVRADCGVDEAGAPLLGLTEFTVLETLASTLLPADASLVVRPHPRQDVHELEARVRALTPAGPVHVLADASLALQIAAADEVHGIFTSALIAASMAGKPTRSLQMGRNAVGRRYSNPHLERMLAPPERNA